MRTCIVCGRGFTTNSSTHIYCSSGCKNKAEEIRKLGKTVEIYTPNEYEVEEQRKLARAERAKAKSAWLLANKSFATFDLETTNLDASIGEILCGCVKPLGQNGKVFVGEKTDAGIVADIRDELEKYDYIITWYGTGFDVPYLTTRLLVSDKRPLAKIRHLDMYYTARTYLKLHSNRQQVAAETLLGQSAKTRVIGSIWNNAMRGNKTAMKYIIEHCIGDVTELEKLFYKLITFRNIGATPLRIY